jgi:hypothetical protein
MGSSTGFSTRFSVGFSTGFTGGVGRGLAGSFNGATVEADEKRLDNESLSEVGSKGLPPKVAENLLSSSGDLGFLGISGDGSFSICLSCCGDLAGANGFGFRELRHGVDVSAGACDSEVVREDKGAALLRRIFSFFTSDTDAIRPCFGVDVCTGLGLDGFAILGLDGCTALGLDGRTTLGLDASSFFAVGARRLGPFARPLVLCVNSGPGPSASFAADLGVWRLSDELLGLAAPEFPANADGPRASSPASAGLKRSDSLLCLTGSFAWLSGAS